MMFAKINHGRVWHIVGPPAPYPQYTFCNKSTNGCQYHLCWRLSDAMPVCKTCLRKVQNMLDELRPELEAAKRRV